MEEKRKDRYNPYTSVGSQVAQQTLMKIDDAYSSFFECIKKIKNVKLLLI